MESIETPPTTKTAPVAGNTLGSRKGVIVYDQVEPTSSEKDIERQRRNFLKKLIEIQRKQNKYRK